ncbi:hypothetical protein BDV97DRAFT_390361 [Delphinella strobiligena]|nr:hypothetical protein BDV97DRAFT_390361 [Delphinella strobiligena]
MYNNPHRYDSVPQPSREVEPPGHCSCRTYRGHAMVQGQYNDDVQDIISYLERVVQTCAHHAPGTCPAGIVQWFHVVTTAPVRMGHEGSPSSQDFAVVCKQALQYCGSQEDSRRFSAGQLKWYELDARALAVGEYANTYQSPHKSLANIVRPIRSIRSTDLGHFTFAYTDYPWYFAQSCSGCSLIRTREENRTGEWFRRRRAQPETNTAGERAPGWTGSFHCRLCPARLTTSGNLVVIMTHRIEEQSCSFWTRRHFNVLIAIGDTLRHLVLIITGFVTINDSLPTVVMDKLYDHDRQLLDEIFLTSADVATEANVLLSNHV